MGLTLCFSCLWKNRTMLEEASPATTPATDAVPDVSTSVPWCLTQRKLCRFQSSANVGHRFFFGGVVTMRRWMLQEVARWHVAVRDNGGWGKVLAATMCASLYKVFIDSVCVRDSACPIHMCRMHPSYIPLAMTSVGNPIANERVVGKGEATTQAM